MGLIGPVTIIKRAATQKHWKAVACGRDGLYEEAIARMGLVMYRRRESGFASRPGFLVSIYLEIIFGRLISGFIPA